MIILTVGYNAFLMESADAAKVLELLSNACSLEGNYKNKYKFDIAETPHTVSAEVTNATIQRILDQESLLALTDNEKKDNVPV